MKKQEKNVKNTLEKKSGEWDSHNLLLIITSSWSERIVGIRKTKIHWNSLIYGSVLHVTS